MYKPKISIIISNFNGIRLSLLKDCIDSLIKPNYPNWELIVVDNASTDDSILYLKKRFRNHKNCFIIENPVNIYSQGLNLGARKASGEYLAYFNNDTAITKDYLNNLVKEFEKDSKLALAQGKLLNYRDHKKIDSAGETMDIFGNPITIGFGEKDLGQFDHNENVLSVSGSANMIRKSTFLRLGGFDPTFGIGYEDMDLALRARRLGYNIKRIPTAIVYHKRAATDSADFIRVKVKWHFNKNRLITMIKNYPLSLLIISLPLTLSLYLLIVFYEWLVKRRWQMGWVRLTSIIWVIFNVHSILASRAKTFLEEAAHLSNNDLSLFSKKSLWVLYKDYLGG